MTNRSASSSASARCDCPRERVLLEALTSDFQRGTIQACSVGRATER